MSLRLASFLTSLVLLAAALAQPFSLRDPVWVGQAVAALDDPVIYSGFEGSGWGAGWYYDEADTTRWTRSTTSGTNFIWGDTAQYSAGSSSLSISPSSDISRTAFATNTLTGLSNVMGKVDFRYVAAPTATQQILSVRDTGGNTMGQLILDTDGGLRVQAYNGTVWETTEKMSANTWYRLYWLYWQGTLNDSQMHGGFCALASGPTKPDLASDFAKSSTDGTDEDPVLRFYFNGFDSDTIQYFDECKVWEGSNFTWADLPD